MWGFLEFEGELEGLAVAEGMGGRGPWGDDK